MSLNIHKIFTCIGDAIRYASRKCGVRYHPTEKSVEDLMLWTSLYRFICKYDRLTEYNLQNTYSRTADIRPLLVDTHKMLQEKVNAARAFCMDVYNGRRRDNYLTQTRDEGLRRLWEVENLYRQVRVLGKIMRDMGKQVPPIPKTTLKEISYLFHIFPIDFTDIYEEGEYNQANPQENTETSG